MSLIDDKVSRVYGATTFTSRDRETPHEGSAWSAEGAILAQVAQEDLGRWGQKGEDAVRVIPPLPGSTQPSRLSLFVFVRGILP